VNGIHTNFLVLFTMEVRMSLASKGGSGEAFTEALVNLAFANVQATTEMTR
jgi:hypothetical protein